MVGKKIMGRLAVHGAIAIALALSAAGMASAAEDSDHDRARQALEAGEVLPLRTILERVEREYPGQVMEVDLERQGDRWIYEIKMLRTGGALVKLIVDGRDGRVLGTRTRAEAGGHHGRKEP